MYGSQDKNCLVFRARFTHRTRFLVSPFSVTRFPVINGEKNEVSQDLRGTITGWQVCDNLWVTSPHGKADRLRTQRTFTGEIDDELVECCTRTHDMSTTSLRGTPPRTLNKAGRSEETSQISPTTSSRPEPSFGSTPPASIANALDWFRAFSASCGLPKTSMGRRLKKILRKATRNAQAAGSSAFTLGHNTPRLNQTLKTTGHEILRKISLQKPT